MAFPDLNIHDGGEYSCEVETDDAEPTAVVHTVEILGNDVHVYDVVVVVVVGYVSLSLCLLKSYKVLKLVYISTKTCRFLR